MIGNCVARASKNGVMRTVLQREMVGNYMGVRTMVQVPLNSELRMNMKKVGLGIGQRRSYHERVLDHYQNPRNVGTLPKTDQDVGTGLVGAPACGDVMKLQIRVDKHNRISDVKFKTFGCGSAIASSSYMTERVKGLTLDEAGRIKNTEIARDLCLPPVKLHCSMLAEDAIKAAIQDFNRKKADGVKCTTGEGTNVHNERAQVEIVN